MSDLEQFIEFFTMKGVPFAEFGNALVVMGVEYKFDGDGDFTGIYHDETGCFNERIPAKEGE